MAHTHIIAVAGKGGVGKTTTCGMIIDYLCKQKVTRSGERNTPFSATGEGLKAL